jgi:hypothetical protein
MRACIRWPLLAVLSVALAGCAGDPASHRVATHPGGSSRVADSTPASSAQYVCSVGGMT